MNVLFDDGKSREVAIMKEKEEDRESRQVGALYLCLGAERPLRPKASKGQTSDGQAEARPSLLFSELLDNGPSSSSATVSRPSTTSAGGQAEVDEGRAGMRPVVVIMYRS